jgi:hypothetical protein
MLRTYGHFVAAILYFSDSYGSPVEGILFSLQEDVSGYKHGNGRRKLLSTGGEKINPTRCNIMMDQKRS